MRIAVRERGDTIIEVMFAFVVFALVSVISFSIMNRGVTIAQRSLEVTQARIQMDAQTNALEYIHQLHVAGLDTTNEWGKMMAKAKASASDFSAMAGASSCRAFVAGQNPFVLNARTARLRTAAPSLAVPAGATTPPYPQVVYNDTNGIDNAYGLWIEAVNGTTATGFVKYVDFHIRACWQSTGSSVPVTLGTIVRLYDPED